MELISKYLPLWQMIIPVVLLFGGFLLNTANEKRKEYNRNRAVKFAIIGWIKVIISDLQQIDNVVKRVIEDSEHAMEFPLQYYSMNQLKVNTNKILGMPELDLSILFSSNVKGNVIDNLTTYSLLRQLLHLIDDFHQSFKSEFPSTIEQPEKIKFSLNNAIYNLQNNMEKDEFVNFGKSHGYSFDEIKKQMERLEKENEEPHILYLLKNKLTKESRASYILESIYNYINNRNDSMKEVVRYAFKTRNTINQFCTELQSTQHKIYDLKIRGWFIWRFFEKLSINKSKSRFYMSKNSIDYLVDSKKFESQFNMKRSLSPFKWEELKPFNPKE